MRIFTTVKHSKDPNFYYGGLWSGNFYPALRQLECEIVESKVDLLPASRLMSVAGNFTRREKEIRAGITQMIIDEVRKAHEAKPVELFLSYFYNSHFNPDGFDEIHKLGIPTVNFYCNSNYQFELVSDVAKKAQFSWHIEKNARETYLEAGANPVWVQMGADPEIYSPLPHVKRRPEACFVGQRYADRNLRLAELIAEGIPVDIYGTGWEAKRGLLPSTLRSYAGAVLTNIKKQGALKGAKRTAAQLAHREENHKVDAAIARRVRGFAENIAETFARYEVILNFSNIWADGRPGSALVPYVRLRDFEAPMCRTCYLTGYTDEIAGSYKLGKEIDTYRDPKELAEKAKFYLDHPATAEKLREAGYRRAVKDHTWKQRFKNLFKKIGVKI